MADYRVMRVVECRRSDSRRSVTENIGAAIGRYRWVICGLLFFATTINYIDRQVLGILSKDLQLAFGWSEVDYGNIVAAFNAAYALGLLLAGRLMDRFGTKIGYSVALIFWSLAAMAHALARSAFGFGVARAALGLGEAGNFPAAIKTVAEWFPKKERAFATGIFNAGIQRRRDRRTAHRSLDRSQLRLALGLYSDRRDRFPLVAFLDSDVREAGSASARQASGARLTFKATLRIHRPTKIPWVQLDTTPANFRFRDRQST